MNMSNKDIVDIFNHPDSTLFDELANATVLKFSQPYIKITKPIKREKEEEEELNDDDIFCISQIENKKAKVILF